MKRPSKTVDELLGARRGVVFSITPGDTAYSGLEKLADKDVGVLIVLQGDRLVGVLSERDCARKLDLRGRTAKSTAVRDVMTTEVLYVTPGHTIDQCMALMKQDRVRHLPVLQDGRVVGVVSARDILEDAVTEGTYLIRDLERDRLVMTVNTGSY
jgi:CBS domain-containing protein